MRPVEISWIEHYDDGSILVKYIDSRSEKITAQDEITVICREYREQKWKRENTPLTFPSLI